MSHLIALPALALVILRSLVKCQGGHSSCKSSCTVHRAVTCDKEYSRRFGAVFSSRFESRFESEKFSKASSTSIRRRWRTIGTLPTYPGVRGPVTVAVAPVRIPFAYWSFSLFSRGFPHPRQDPRLASFLNSSSLFSRIPAPCPNPQVQPPG